MPRAPQAVETGGLSSGAAARSATLSAWKSASFIRGTKPSPPPSWSPPSARLYLRDGAEWRMRRECPMPVGRPTSRAALARVEHAERAQLCVGVLCWIASRAGCRRRRRCWRSRARRSIEGAAATTAGRASDCEIAWLQRLRPRAAQAVDAPRAAGQRRPAGGRGAVPRRRAVCRRSRFARPSAKTHVSAGPSIGFAPQVILEDVGARRPVTRRRRSAASMRCSARPQRPWRANRERALGATRGSRRRESGDRRHRSQRRRSWARVDASASVRTRARGGGGAGPLAARHPTSRRHSARRFRRRATRPSRRR